MALDVDAVAIRQRRWWRHTVHGADPLPRRLPPPDNRWQRGAIVEAVYLAGDEAIVWAEWSRGAVVSPGLLLTPAIWPYTECHMAEEGSRMLSTARIARTLGGSTVFHGEVRSADALRARLRAGLPYAALEAVAAGFQITRRDLEALLHLPARTLARRKRARHLRADESDRLFRVGRIAALAEAVLGDRDKATRWLHAPNRALGLAVPLRRLDTELGAREVEDVLLRVAHGVHS